MPAYSQDHSVFRLTTPLGKDVLLLRRIKGTEGISELFDLELEALVTNDTSVSFDVAPRAVRDCLGLHPRRQPGEVLQRALHRAGRGGSGNARGGQEVLHLLPAPDRPEGLVLGLAHRSRVFQEIAVPAILQKVFAGFATDFRLERTYEPREMCLQYRENDLAFACRLMEEEGIRWFFRHEDGNHTLVITDSGAYDDLPGPGPASLRCPRGGSAGRGPDLGVEKEAGADARAR